MDQQETPEKLVKAKKKRPLYARVIRGVLKTFAVVFVLLVILILVVRSPWGQNLIIGKVTSYVSEKTNTRVEVEKLFITFSGDILLDGLYLEDKKGDTLVYSRHLQADMPLWPIIRGGGIGVDNLEWEGVRAHVYRKDSLEGFNYQFLIDAFVTTDTTAVETPEDSTTLDLSLGSFALVDIKVDFEDQIGGIYASMNLGSLDLDMDAIDLEKMRYEVGNVLLKNSTVVYRIDKIQPVSPPSDGPLPLLSIDDLQLENVKASYVSVPDGIDADLDVGLFGIELPLADLAQSQIEVDRVTLKNAKIKVAMTRGITDKVAAKTDSIATKASKDFEWPAFNIKIDKIDFAQNNIAYSVNGAQPKSNVFNADAMEIEDLNIQARDIKYEPKNATLTLNDFSFTEASGLNLGKFAVNIQATDQKLDINGIDIALNNNSLKGEASLDYPSLATLIKKPETTSIALALSQIKLNVREAFRFQPDLVKNPYLKALSKRPITGQIKAEGKLADVAVNTFDLNWGPSTTIRARGRIRNATDPDRLRYNFQKIVINSTKNDLNHFVDEDSLGVDLPKNIKLVANLKGSTKDVDVIAALTTSEGALRLDAKADFGDAIAFNGIVSVDSLNLGKLLKNEQLGKLDLNIKASGSGSTVNTFDATVNGTINRFQYNGYAITDLKINGDLKNGKGDIKSAYTDENLNAALDVYVELDSVAPLARVNLDVVGANLQALGLLSRNVKTALKLKANFKGNAESFDLDTQITDGVMVYDNKTYLLGDFNLSAFVREDTTSVDLTNRMIDLHLESNANPTALTAAIQRHLQTYLTTNPQVDTLTNPVKVKVRGSINESPVLKEVLVANLRELDTVSIKMDFDEKKRSLTANINAPFIDYNGNQLDSLAFNLDSNKENLDFDLGLKGVEAGPLSIQRTLINGTVAKNELNVDFTSFKEEKRLMHIGTRLARVNEQLQLMIDREDLLLNGEDWTIKQDNAIVFNKELTQFKNFMLNRGDQQINVSNAMAKATDKHIGISFQNFKLSTLLSYLNPEEDLANGKLNGELIIENPTEKPGLLADLTINELKVLNVPMGTLSLAAKSKNGTEYDFNLGIKGGAADLDLTGDYAANSEGALLDLDLALNKINMETVQAFTFGELKQSSGSFSGNIKVTGTTAEPQYDGNIDFKDAQFNIAKLNTGFALTSESLRLDNKGVYMDNFNIRDADKNTFIVDGQIGTESFLNPTFDLSLKAKNFKVLNSTKEDFDLVYGKASFDIDAQVTGDLNLPKVNMTLGVGKTTNFTYVIPASEAAVESRDGVVIFVNRENPNSILTQTEKKSYTLSGFEIEARLKVPEEAIFNIILDKDTGDNFQAQGNADLDFNMYPNGRMTLTGAYDVKQGHYEMNLYGLVKRKFELSDESRVSWSGDPLGAKLDVKAFYDVETSASALMAPIDRSQSGSENSQYKQQLDFLVYINITGEMLQPKIDFNLDLAKEDQSIGGGRVYARVKDLNQQEDELNKQVFSLLVLNKFFPSSGSSGEGGGTASIARDNINDAISDQLNTFSDKLLGKSGVSLDFGLDSYTDYQGSSPQDRTTLDVAAQKKLLDDRLVVRVGSEVDLQGSAPQSEGESPLVGNVSLEYLLTEDGRFRLKGFRRNEFENVIDGQLIVSGLSFIFTKEFNKFDELWRSMFRPKKEDEEENVKAKPKVDSEDDKK